jgi:hypothetical protein
MTSLEKIIHRTTQVATTTIEEIIEFNSFLTYIKNESISKSNQNHSIAHSL